MAKPNWTVWCNSDRSKTQHFVDRAEAIQYANDLNATGEKAVLRPYTPP
jgi:hypothetical protein